MSATDPEPTPRRRRALVNGSADDWPSDDAAWRAVVQTRLVNLDRSVSAVDGKVDRLLERALRPGAWERLCAAPLGKDGANVRYLVLAAIVVVGVGGAGGGAAVQFGWGDASITTGAPSPEPTP